MQTVHLTGRAD